MRVRWKGESRLSGRDGDHVRETWPAWKYYAEHVGTAIGAPAFIDMAVLQALLRLLLNFKATSSAEVAHLSGWKAVLEVPRGRFAARKRHDVIVSISPTST